MAVRFPVWERDRASEIQKQQQKSKPASATTRKFCFFVCVWFLFFWAATAEAESHGVSSQIGSGLFGVAFQGGFQGVPGPLRIAFPKALRRVLPEKVAGELSPAHFLVFPSRGELRVNSSLVSARAGRGQHLTKILSFRKGGPQCDSQYQGETCEVDTDGK